MKAIDRKVERGANPFLGGNLKEVRDSLMIIGLSGSSLGGISRHPRGGWNIEEAQVKRGSRSRLKYLSERDTRPGVYKFLDHLSGIRSTYSISPKCL
jgi:hypothetical protein